VCTHSGKNLRTSVKQTFILESYEVNDHHLE